MGDRILTLQRQAREIGRLRTGYTVPKTSRGGKQYDAPEKSDTWVLTSPQQEAIELAAETWGGTPEQWQPQGAGAPGWRVITQSPSIDAILPPGDPIHQAYEQWSKGGCQVRCDGETAKNPENQSAPCLCLARFGDDWYRRDPKEVCRPHTRLRVILPQLPDLGVWRAESQGFHAANDLPAQVDLIRAAVGDRALVPISLRIVPFTRVRQGETIQTQTIVLSIRGAVAGQLLAGQVPQLTAGMSQLGQATQQPLALRADEQPAVALPGDWSGLIAQAQTIEALREVWRDADNLGGLTDPLKKLFWARKAEIDQKPAGPQPPIESAPEGPEPDRDATWLQITGAAGNKGWSTDQLIVQFEKAVGVSHYDADGWAMASFLELLQTGRI